MLTNDQVVDLLTLAAAYDRRKVGLADVAAWRDAAERGRWQPAAALDAVKAHYATSTAWLMPGHVAEIIRAERRQPAPFQAPPPAPAIEYVVRDALPSVDEPQRRPESRPLISRISRRARRPRMDADARARITAELDAKRPAAEEPS
jgi:hypothetical protein